MKKWSFSDGTHAWRPFDDADNDMLNTATGQGATTTVLGGGRIVDLRDLIMLIEATRQYCVVTNSACDHQKSPDASEQQPPAKKQAISCNDQPQSLFCSNHIDVDREMK